MKRDVPIAVFALVVAACTGGTVETPTTGPEATSTSTGVASTTTTAVVTTTTHSLAFPDVAFPDTGVCEIDIAPAEGEATVVVDGRLYGLGTDGLSPHCLVEGVDSSELEWGPKGDEVIIGLRALGPNFEFVPSSALGLIWTQPTGSSVVAFSNDRLWKVAVEDGTEKDITFLATTEAVAYHPAGEHILAIGTDFNGQYGLWLATNQGSSPLLMAFDEGAILSDPAWTWLGEPIFAAAHDDGTSHIHRVELTAEGGFDGPIIVESGVTLDTLIPSPFDPIMLAYRTAGTPGTGCVEDAHVAVSNVDVPEPLNSWTTNPVGWLPGERLLVLAYPDGCESPGDLWSFSPGLCPGSVYGAFPIISGVDGAATRAPVPAAPPPPDFSGVIDPAPA